MKNIRFEWDENKNKINKKKHGLSFEEAVEVFGDENAILFDDPDHSLYEDRFLIILQEKQQRVRKRYIRKGGRNARRIRY